MFAKLVRAARGAAGLAVLIGSLTLSGCVVVVPHDHYHHHYYYHDRDYD